MWETMSWELYKWLAQQNVGSAEHPVLPQPLRLGAVLPCLHVKQASLNWRWEPFLRLLSNSLFVPLKEFVFIPKWAHEMLAPTSAQSFCSGKLWTSSLDNASSDLREALRFAQGCAEWPVAGTAPWASDSPFRLAYTSPNTDGPRPACSRLHKPACTHISPRGSLGYSNRRNPFACVNQV